MRNVLSQGFAVIGTNVGNSVCEALLYLFNDLANTYVHEMCHRCRQALLTETAGLRRPKQLPVEVLEEKKVLTFPTALRERFSEKCRIFTKKHLKLLVDESRHQKRRQVMKGSCAALAKLGGGQAGHPTG